MQNIFGEKLRALRLDAGLGLRELARHLDKSPGYISDVENGRINASTGLIIIPSEAIIIKISEILGVDKNELLLAAKKVDPEITRYVAEERHAVDFLRKAKESDWDLEKVLKLAEIANPSKENKEIK